MERILCTADSRRSNDLEARLEMSASSNRQLTAKQYQILNAWRDVLGDVRRLCASLTSLPDDCPCGDAHGHLAGKCACCQERRATARPECDDCQSSMAKLTPSFNELTVDTWRFFPSALEFLALREKETGESDVRSAKHHFEMVAKESATSSFERHIGSVVQTFERLVHAVDEFRVGCRGSHLQALKQAARDLSREVDQIERLV